MIQQLHGTYIRYRWVKSIAFVALVASSVLLYWYTGGFPPWSWRLLAKTLPLLPQLWETHGPGIVLPLIGLVLISLALLIMWPLLALAAITIGRQWWQDFHSRQSFAADLQAAEELAEAVTTAGALQQQDLYTWQEQEEMPTPIPARRATYTSERASEMEQAANAPLRAAVPAYPKLVLSQRSAPLVKSVQAASSMRGQLRIVPPTPERQQGGFSVTQRPSKELDIEQYDTTPAGTASLEEDEAKSKHDLKGQQASNEPKQTDYMTQEMARSEALLDSVQSGVTRLRLSVGVCLDPGIARKDAPNEDTLLAVQGTRITEEGPEPVGLFIVADGMGGHANGQEASRTAIQAMSDVIVPIIMRGIGGDDNFLELLREGAHRANLAIYQRNRQQDRMMGTTLTAALVVAHTAHIVNVGDSRTYIYRKGATLSPITRDHSIVARMVESGDITRDEIYTHPKRNQIYRCLGDRSTVEVDTFVEELHYNDVLMLCSDGLWEMVRDKDMQGIIEASATHPSQTSSMLVQAALDRGGADNVSVVVVHMARAESAC